MRCIGMVVTSRGLIQAPGSRRTGVFNARDAIACNRAVQVDVPSHTVLGPRPMQCWNVRVRCRGNGEVLRAGGRTGVELSVLARAVRRFDRH